ncbi:RNA helicase [Toensbergia leucococca]|nr:RNA helicase [Toensbergia leucococca]
MALSPRVSRPPDKVTANGKPFKRRSNSPFGGMNLTSAQIRHVPHSRSDAELKRSSRGRDPPKREIEKVETFKALKMQRALSAVSYGHRSSVKEKIRDIDTFDQFSLLPVIKDSVTAEALLGMEDVSPTPIQRLAIPTLLGDDGSSRRRRSSRVHNEEMGQFLLAAETGSGKTLAYLLPVLDAIKRAEAIDIDNKARETVMREENRKATNSFELDPPPLSNQPHPTTGRPRAIILVPTSELVNQVGNLTKALSHTIKFRSALISSAFTGKVIRNRLFTPTGVDLLVTTPHLLSSIAESDPNILSRVSHLVIDEADSLLDRSFAPSTSVIIDKATSSLRQLILCSATIPRSLDSYLRKRFPDMRRLVTPNLHAIPRRVQLGVVDVEKEPYHGNKNLACADTIWSIGKAAAEHVITHNVEGIETEHIDVKRILVFVNEREKTQEVTEYLQSKGVDAIALNRDTPEQRQSESLGAFTTSTPQTISLKPQQPSTQPDRTNFVAANRASTSSEPQKRHLPNTKVLVTTDLGSRGIDTLAVRHVILYDVPHSTIDFIHRLGRTGRMGRRGRGIVLVGKGDRRDVVREVKEGMFKGQALI